VRRGIRSEGKERAAVILLRIDELDQPVGEKLGRILTFGKLDLGPVLAILRASFEEAD